MRLSERVGRFDRLAATLAEAAERAADSAPADGALQRSLGHPPRQDRRHRRRDRSAARILPLAERRSRDPAGGGRRARAPARAHRPQAELCDALERLATLATAPTERKNALREVARLSANELGDTARAIRAHEARIALDPGDLEALDDSIPLARSERADRGARARAGAAGRRHQRLYQISIMKIGHIDTTVTTSPTNSCPMTIGTWMADFAQSSRS